MQTCPNCGYCQYCGRANFTPWYPQPWWTQPTVQPYWIYNPTTYNSGNFTITSDSTSYSYGFNFKSGDESGGVGAKLN